MQFEISDEAAICFTHEFYAAIAGGYPVDAALSEARKAIFAQVNEIEWGTPVLYMRGPDARVFDIEQISDAERLEAERARAAEEARRAEERRGTRRGSTARRRAAGERGATGGHRGARQNERKEADERRRS